jgi:hypothetical protein
MLIKHKNTDLNIAMENMEKTILRDMVIPTMWPLSSAWRSEWSRPSPSREHPSSMERTLTAAAPTNIPFPLFDYSRLLLPTPNPQADRTPREIFSLVGAQPVRPVEMGEAIKTEVLRLGEGVAGEECLAFNVMGLEGHIRRIRQSRY